MGLSKSKQKSSTTPVYGTELQGAGHTLTDVYNQQAPKIAGYADQLGSLGSDLLAKYKAGNPMVDAASHYVTTTLNGDPQHNPYLNDIINTSNNDVRNQLEAAAGSRGTTGGSDYYNMIAKTLAQNESGLRYTDYNNAMDRKAQAAGLAPGVAAADYLSIAPGISATEAGATLPFDAASRYAAGMGGLLGQYTNTKTTSSPGLGGLLAGVIGSGLGGWASGGFKL